MPQLAGLIQPQADPFAFANQQAIRDLVETIRKLKLQRRQREIQGRILPIMASALPPQEKQAAIVQEIMNYQTEQRPSPRPGISGFIHRLFEGFDPTSAARYQTTPLEDVITGRMLETAMPTPVEQARIQYYQRGPAERSFKVNWYDKRGKMRSQLVSESQYDSFVDRIAKAGGTLDEPESLQDQLKYWQGIEKAARGATGTDLIAQTLAKLSGTDPTIQTNEQLAAFARQKIDEIIRKMQGQRGPSGPPTEEQLREEGFLYDRQVAPSPKTDSIGAAVDEAIRRLGAGATFEQLKAEAARILRQKK